MSHQTGATGDMVNGARPIFSFSYRSIPFHVQLRETGDGLTGMPEAVIGVLPFTVDGSSLRSTMLAAISEVRQTEGYGIDIGPDHRIALSMPLPVDGAQPAAEILAAAMERLAGAKAFLDLVLMLQPPHLRRYVET